MMQEIYKVTGPPVVKHENHHVREARQEGDIDVTGGLYTPPPNTAGHLREKGMYWPPKKCFCMDCLQFTLHLMSMYGLCVYIRQVTKVFYTKYGTVIKVFSPAYRKSSYTSEVQSLLQLEGCAHAPKLLRYWMETNPDLAPPGSCCIEMERLQQWPSNLKIIGAPSLIYILSAVRQLYRRGIMHKDLWPPNIMWRGRCIVFIDYENARIMPLNTSKGYNSGVFQQFTQTERLQDEIEIAMRLFQELKQVFENK